MTPEELRKEFQEANSASYAEWVIEEWTKGETEKRYCDFLETRCLEQDSTIAELKREVETIRDKALEEAAKIAEGEMLDGQMLTHNIAVRKIVAAIRALASLRKSQERPE